MSRNTVGDYGEKLALRHYQRQGYTSLENNYRCRMGEVDLIVQAPSGTLVFIEVKTRSASSPMMPREAVTPAKRRKLVLAAQHYLARHGLSDPLMRFDVVEILVKSDGSFVINCIENAF